MTHDSDSEGCCVQKGKYLRRGATLFLAAAGDGAIAASWQGRDLHGSVGDTWLHHHKETKQTKFTDRITERSRSRGCVGNGRCRGSPSRAWNGILHFVYFSPFSSRLIGCPHNFLSGTGGLLSITLSLAVAFVNARRNFDFICAFRTADRVLILLIHICLSIVLGINARLVETEL